MSIRILCVLLTLSGAALADDTAAIRADNIPDRETEIMYLISQKPYSARFMMRTDIKGRSVV